MFRRCTASLALAIAAAGPASALASGTTNYAYYELVNTRPTALNNEVVLLNVVPPNSIAAPDAANPSPLTIVTSTFAFDQTKLQGFTSPADPTSQMLALDFVNGGLASGGVLQFKLSLASDVSSATVPQLQIQSPDQDLALISLPAPSPPVTTAVAATTTTAAPTGADTAFVPEPVSLALWSFMAAAGLVRARAFRRSRRALA